MGTFLLVCGSAVGAALAWLVGRRVRSRPAVAACSGVACALLGAVIAASRGMMLPMAEVGFGVLGTLAPLTLCTTSTKSDANNPDVSAAIRGFSATLALALVYGIACTAVGFASGYGLWYEDNHDLSQADSSVLAPSRPGNHAAAP